MKFNNEKTIFEYMNNTAKAREVKQLKSKNRKDIADMHSNDLLETKYNRSIEMIEYKNS